VDEDTPEAKLVMAYATLATMSLAEAKLGKGYPAADPTPERPNCKKSAELQSAQRMIEVAVMHDVLVEQKAPGYAGKGTLSYWTLADHHVIGRYRSEAQTACFIKDMLEYPSAKTSPYIIEEHPLIEKTREQVFASVGRMAVAIDAMADSRQPLKGPYFCDTSGDLADVWQSWMMNANSTEARSAYSAQLVKFKTARSRYCPE
jgi:hypothetical protein